MNHSLPSISGITAGTDSVLVRMNSETSVTPEFGIVVRLPSRSQVVSEEPLLTGTRASLLAGTAENADIIILLPTGEPVFAHSRYLVRSPYFKAHTEFNELTNQSNQDESGFKVLKVLPPFPHEFRLFLRCLYANTSEFTESVCTQQNLVALLVNAEYFQQSAVLAGCIASFSKNWVTAIQDSHFRSHFIDSDLLAKLLTKTLTAVSKLHIILQWACEWNDEDSCKELRKFVESNVRFIDVPYAEWLDLIKKFEHSVECCITTKRHIHYYRLGSRNETTCKYCHQWFESSQRMAVESKRCPSRSSSFSVYQNSDDKHVLL